MNIRDIARIANVTPGTVSKVLNNYPEISEATRQHVLEVISANQYDPTANLRYAKSQPSSVRIGMVVEGVYNHLYAVMEDMLSRRIHNAGHPILSFHDNFYSQDKEEKFQELTAYISAQKLAALIYIGGNFEQLDEEKLGGLGCPIIFVNTVLPLPVESAQYSSVQVNHYDAAYAQMCYLIRQGHRNICTVISSTIDNSVYGIRFEAYKDALRKHGLESGPEVFLQSDYVNLKAHRALTEYLRVRPDTTAVCCMADIIVPAALRAIHDVGKIAGKDIAVISFDGSGVLSYCVPSVTTFEQPKDDMVDFICDLLFGLIGGKRNHQHIIFQAKFIRGESC